MVYEQHAIRSPGSAGFGSALDSMYVLSGPQNYAPPENSLDRYMDMALQVENKDPSLRYKGDTSNLKPTDINSGLSPVNENYDSGSVYSIDQHCCN